MEWVTDVLLMIFSQVQPMAKQNNDIRSNRYDENCELPDINNISHYFEINYDIYGWIFVPLNVNGKCCNPIIHFAVLSKFSFKSFYWSCFLIRSLKLNIAQRLELYDSLLLILAKSMLLKKPTLEEWLEVRIELER